jgi:3-oxoacyl-[acyl-carrier protein] reductase
VDLGLAGRLVAVTGASRGIGRAVAAGVVREGGRVLAVARDAGGLERLRAELGDAVACLPADLADPAERVRVSAAAADVWGLVNLAGAIPSGEIDEVEDAAWRRGWELKLFGYMDLARGVYAPMKARGAGVIVNVIGMAGKRLDARNILGSTANAALIAFTCALGARAADHGVRVVGVNPGLTATARAEGVLRHRAARELGDADRWRELCAGLPFGRMAEPGEVADLVVFLLSPLRAAYLSGTVLDVDGGLAGRP